MKMQGGRPTAGTEIQPPTYSVPAVDKALRILRTLAGPNDGLGLAELASHLGLPKSTVLSILTTLAHHHFVERDSSGKWSLGLAAFEVGSAYASRMDLLTAFRAIAGPLASQCGQTIQLAVLDGTEVVYVGMVDGTEPVRLVSRVGARLPAHTTALGKALLAGLPDGQFESLYSGSVLTPLTSFSIVSLEALRDELSRIRLQGTAYDNEETAVGLHCVAKQIMGRQGQPVAAISVSIPSHRMSEARQSQTEGLVRTAADEISRRLGWAEISAAVRDNE
jgi:IclR family KDG regulon transcriptional repressor